MRVTIKGLKKWGVKQGIPELQTKKIKPLAGMA
jgi:hypothetical protein